MSDTDGGLTTYSQIINKQPSTTKSVGHITTPSTAARPISKPVDPDAPSFLTLPSEIRNAVYEALFKKEEDILLAYKQLDGERHSQSTIISGVGLLASCQQVYAEAVAILYASNTFSVMADKSCDPVLQSTLQWFTQIGRHACLVRYVQVDTRSMTGLPIEFDVLPLLRLLWLHQDTGLEITFVDAINHSSSKNWNKSVEPWMDTTDRRIKFNVRAVNTVLRRLQTDFDLNIRRYNAIPQLLSAILLTSDGDRGFVEFYSTLSYAEESLDHAEEFTIDYAKDSSLPNFIFRIDEERLRRDKTWTRHGLHKLWDSPRVAETILDMLVPTEEVVVYDLTKRTISPAISGILSVDRSIRARASRRFYENVPHGKAIIKEPKTSFCNEIAALNQWVRLYLDWECSNCLWCRQKIITLRFELQEPTTLDDIRFEAVRLVKTTLPCYTETTVHIELVYPTPQGKHEERFSTKLSHMRDNVLVFLDDISCHRSSYEDIPCPDIWMNGQGVACEAQFPSDNDSHTTIANPHRDQSNASIRDMATAIARKRKDMKPPSLNGLSDRPMDTLHECIWGLSSCLKHRMPLKDRLAYA
jgi:hypothetical protein